MDRPAPRLHVLLARDADYGVVLRRGPSKQVASIGWNLKLDTFDLGQWLKGRIYAYRADLSPDGKRMIYFAMNGRWDDELSGSWTAVSRTPYLTAEHVYGWGHCWNGGGLFVDNQTYWLNTSGMEQGKASKLIACGIERTEVPPDGMAPYFGECPGIYLPKLLRDGWTHQTSGSDAGQSWSAYNKPVRARWSLEKTFHIGSRAGPNNEVYCETHRLVGPTGTIELDGAEWADTRQSAVLYAQGGQLWRQHIHVKGPDEAVMLYDFGPMTFEGRQAPYAGIRKGDIA